MIRTTYNASPISWHKIEYTKIHTDGAKIKVVFMMRGNAFFEVNHLDLSVANSVAWGIINECAIVKEIQERVNLAQGQYHGEHRVTAYNCFRYLPEVGDSIHIYDRCMLKFGFAISGLRDPKVESNLRSGPSDPKVESNLRSGSNDVEMYRGRSRSRD